MARLQKKLQMQKKTMSTLERISLEHRIQELQKYIETPADKILQLRQQITDFEKRASAFPPESEEYKIIAQSILHIQQAIQNIEINIKDIEPLSVKKKAQQTSLDKDIAILTETEFD